MTLAFGQKGTRAYTGIGAELCKLQTGMGDRPALLVLTSS